MKLKFLGAAGTVTGSKYLLTTHQERFLVDCGLFQGLKNLRTRNWHTLATDAKKISAVFLTHAHIDHSGYLPRLVTLGFKGRVYCSQGTYELAKILLPDSGYLQEEEARYANKKGYSKHKPALPLYTREDAENTLQYFHPIEFNKKTSVGNDASITLYKVGHILGASSVLFEVQGRSILFSGDVGRYKDAIMRAPEPAPDADVLVIESTYGDRLHDDDEVESKLADVINDTIAKKGTIVVPAFAVGRAQLLLYYIAKLKAAKKIPSLKTYLDSPMAINATDLYCRYHNDHRLSDDMCRAMCSDVIITHTPEESRAINEVKEPKIIISASGMASGGRIIHHLAQYVIHEENTILFVGFQAAGTRGRSLLEGAEQIKMFGHHYKVSARIEYLTGLSAHADYRELIRWINESRLHRPKVFVTHGEKSSAQAFQQRLIDTFHWRVEQPADGDEVEI